MPRRLSSFELPFVLPRSAGGHQRTLYDGLCAAISAGQLRPGARLPSSRELARQYGVARATVVAVYEQLRAEGYLSAQAGAGTFVNAELPDATLRRPRNTARLGPAVRPRLPALSPAGRALSQPGFPSPAAIAGATHPFAAHLPALDEFPRELWSRVMAREVRRLPASALGDGDPLGLPALRRAICDYLGAARGVACEPEQILVVSGTQQALDLCARLLLAPGDAVIVEDPGYVGARRVLEAAGARISAGSVDEFGLDVARAVQACPDARLVHVTPAHQVPTGAVLALPRRQLLLDWAARTGAWVFEDDYDSEYRYAGRPIPALHGIDANGQVLHAASFGKTMFPGLRIGYLVLPAHLVEAFAAARANVDRFPSVLHQAAMAGFLSEGHYARHLRRMRLLYAARYEALTDSLHRHASDLIELPSVPAGLETVVWLARGLDDATVARRLAEEGIRAEPVSKSRIHRDERPGLVLGFAAFDPGAMDKAIRLMSRLLRAML